MLGAQSGNRADVDGLRSIAVLPVVLFHAGFSVFSGGYVGVDVFFVISGFVITRSIHSELSRGEGFSFVKFYRRRVRRLLPASVATCLACLVLGYMYLPPEGMESLGAQDVTSIFWSSNIYFWLTAGYFDLASHSKPLLHMWSLSVEEQFYFIWPTILVLLYRFRGSIIPTLLAMAIISVVATNI